MGAVAIYEFTSGRLEPLQKTSFSDESVLERRDLQAALRQNISILVPDGLVIAEEFGEWDDSRRRIDLLAVDRMANLVVIELKRTDDGGHMDLQAIRYAAMVSTMTFDQAVMAFDQYLRDSGDETTDGRSELLNFLRWDEPRLDQFGQDVRIVLAAADFSIEVTTAVLWLIQRDIDIRCIRLQPVKLTDRILVDVQQVIPPPEASEYQVRLRDKNRQERVARSQTSDRSKYDLKLGDQLYGAETKRGAILRVFQFLVANEINPEDVASQCGARANRAVRAVDGIVGYDDFVERATLSRADIGKRFDPIRWFCGDDQLVHFGGRTYALSSQWGGEDWEAAMTNLQRAYPQFGISFTPTLG